MEWIAQFKERQKEGWAHFGPLATFSTTPAATLVKHARIASGQRVLDVACGTGVVAITAARAGARATGVDLTPEMIAAARDNARIAGVSVEWHEGDVEQLPFDDGAFDVVVSQFGHMFAPRPEVAIGEMLRVLRPGGTIAFATWPPEVCIGQTMKLAAAYLPPPPPGMAPPALWGEPTVIAERLGGGVTDLVFDRARMLVPALSTQHYRAISERAAGPLRTLVAMLQTTDPARLEQFQRAYDALVANYFDDNVVRQDYLLTRATKV